MRQYTAAELADLLGLPLTGPPTPAISGAAPLTDARPHEIAFVGAPKYFEEAKKSTAGCLIALATYAPAPGQTVIHSPQPRAHFAQVLTILYPTPAANPGIHPSASVSPEAHVDPTAEIGPFVTIGPDTQIAAHSRIGAGCAIGASVIIGEASVLHPRVTIYHRVSIGSRAILHAGAVIGADGFGFEMHEGRYHKVPQVGTVEIGDDTEIGANTSIDRAALGVTSIGHGTKLDNGVHIGHNCRIGNHVVIAAQTGLAGGVTIGDYAIIGGQVGFGDKARVESRAIIGSGAGILTSKI
ncbi:MAG TPA: UDP-3-O-(3-hydroxymyristoyl)glucosamine N-acyltransferase, partial [Bryobacteraceae bacterium]|nr:UDP-3-O-(3-hydroxymyristoyl)glucosamine N-acyltransferase [Bryobacteraceae bacterium]